RASTSTCSGNGSSSRNGCGGRRMPRRRNRLPSGVEEGVERAVILSRPFGCAQGRLRCVAEGVAAEDGRRTPLPANPVGGGVYERCKHSGVLRPSFATAPSATQRSLS